MIYLSWNCGSLVNPRAVRAQKELILSKKPNIIFLCETLVHSNKIEEIKVHFGYDYCFSEDNLGGGGLAVLWNNSSLITITSFSANYTNISISGMNSINWGLTESWNLLSHLEGSSSLPWVCIGDFNNLLNLEDKRAGNPHSDYLCY
ncbi:hypothetical protein P3X46_004440, partial [Hevea brasiliensis]